MIGTVLEIGIFILLLALCVCVGAFFGFIVGDVAFDDRVENDNRRLAVLFTGCGIGVFVFICIVYFSGQGPDDWERLCAGAGGRVETSTSSSVQPGPNGTVVPTSSSSDFCVTPDGRLLGAR